jgi:hypothetical protein
MAAWRPEIGIVIGESQGAFNGSGGIGTKCRREAREEPERDERGG